MKQDWKSKIISKVFSKYLKDIDSVSCQDTSLWEPKPLLVVQIFFPIHLLSFTTPIKHLPGAISAQNPCVCVTMQSQTESCTWVQKQLPETFPSHPHWVPPKGRSVTSSYICYKFSCELLASRWCSRKRPFSDTSPKPLPDVVYPDFTQCCKLQQPFKYKINLFAKMSKEWGVGKKQTPLMLFTWSPELLDSFFKAVFPETN